jgi:hypothetical protein
MVTVMVNGNGHGQSNTYIQSNDKAKGKDNGRGNRLLRQLVITATQN